MNRFLCLLFLLTLGACQSANSPNPPTPFNEEHPVVTISPPAQSRSITTAKCPLQGKILPSNRIPLASAKAIICIAADSTTYNKEFGDSHRKVAIYDTHTCRPRSEWTLPINKSPDFHYYVADTCRYKSRNLVFIKGFNTLHCLDVQQTKLSPAITPSYKAKRQAQDAQSGNIIQVKVWKDYLVGYAQDMGTFVFQITDSTTLQPILPYAEYRYTASLINSVYLLNLANNKTQVILPQYDWEEEQLSINPIYETPVSLQRKVIKSALNNRFLILTSFEPTAVVGLDLKTGKKERIPTGLQNKGIKEMVAWLKERVDY